MWFILGLFHSEEHNPHSAQLVFATHDTQLLSPRFFRRDQVWFTTKNPYGWCVFDRDSFPAKDYNIGIEQARAKGFKVAYSNEAFEIYENLLILTFSVDSKSHVGWAVCPPLLNLVVGKKKTLLHFNQ